jgi:hypothetical protein
VCGTRSRCLEKGSEFPKLRKTSRWFDSETGAGGLKSLADLKRDSLLVTTEKAVHCFKVKEPKNQITKYNGGGNQYRGKQTLNTQQTDHNENE